MGVNKISTFVSHIKLRPNDMDEIEIEGVAQLSMQ